MTDATIIDGRAYSREICSRLAAFVNKLKIDHSIRPSLATVFVGSNPGSEIYVRKKHIQAKEVGIVSSVHKLPDSIAEPSLSSLIRGLNNDKTVHGILVQLPLPSHISTQRIINTINPIKDVDGFHPYNVGRLLSGFHSGIIPCTPLGCLKLLRRQYTDMSGMHAAVIGRSNIVGKPMAALLIKENCTVTIAHSKTRNLPCLCRQVDIIIAATGQAELVRGSWVNPGATVIDVGINRIFSEDGKQHLVGDVRFQEVAKIAGAITPVPGGVGPVTIAMLLYNTLLACCTQLGIDTANVHILLK